MDSPAGQKVLLELFIRTNKPMRQPRSAGRLCVVIWVHGSMTAQFDAPSIPARVQRPLAAIWVSLGLHAAVIALVQIAPPGAVTSNGPVIEARLVSTQHRVFDAPGKTQPELLPSDQGKALPVDTPQESAPPVSDEPLPAETVAAQFAAAPAASPLAIASAADLTFYSAREVDVHPRALDEIAPDYPDKADKQKLSGKVIVQLKLEADGRVVDVDVIEATPPDVFEQTTVEAFRAARFSPAFKGGRPVRSLMMIEMTFDWAGRSR